MGKMLKVWKKLVEVEIARCGKGKQQAAGAWRNNFSERERKTLPGNALIPRRGELSRALTGRRRVEERQRAANVDGCRKTVDEAVVGAVTLRDVCDLRLSLARMEFHFYDQDSSWRNLPYATSSHRVVVCCVQLNSSNLLSNICCGL